jgi:hypothetical protein
MLVTDDMLLSYSKKVDFMYFMKIFFDENSTLEEADLVILMKNDFDRFWDKLSPIRKSKYLDIVKKYYVKNIQKKIIKNKKIYR